MSASIQSRWEVRFKFDIIKQLENPISMAISNSTGIMYISEAFGNYCISMIKAIVVNILAVKALEVDNSITLLVLLSMRVVAVKSNKQLQVP